MSLFDMFLHDLPRLIFIIVLSTVCTLLTVSAFVWVTFGTIIQLNNSTWITVLIVAGIVSTANIVARWIKDNYIPTQDEEN